MIKVGGSLSRGQHLQSLCLQLSRLGREHQMLVVPGGGEFTDAVRKKARHFHLDDSTAHWMAILGMDQFGYLLSSQIPKAVPVRSVRFAREVAQEGRVPVLLPFQLLERADPLPHSWSVTSDSIAAWMGMAVAASRLVLLKDVDGLFRDDPSHCETSDLLSEVTLDQLAASGGVDSHLAGLMCGSQMGLWVINGRQPDRLEQLLKKGWTKGTRLCPQGCVHSRTCVYPSGF